MATSRIAAVTAFDSIELITAIAAFLDHLPNGADLSFNLRQPRRDWLLLRRGTFKEKALIPEFIVHLAFIPFALPVVAMEPRERYYKPQREADSDIRMRTVQINALRQT